MFESFECQCVYVEIHNDSHPRSGRVEYRAKSCPVCQARADWAPVAFELLAQRYQRTH